MAGPRSWRGGPGAPVSGEYRDLREELLAGTAHIDLPREALAYQAGACAGSRRRPVCGTDAPRRAALCAEGMESGELLVKELLCPPEDLDWVVERPPVCCPGWSSAWRTSKERTTLGCSSGSTRSWSGPGTGPPPPIWASHLTERQYHSYIIFVNGWISLWNPAIFWPYTQKNGGSSMKKNKTEKRPQLFRCGNTHKNLLYIRKPLWYTCT